MPAITCMIRPWLTGLGMVMEILLIRNSRLKFPEKGPGFKRHRGLSAERKKKTGEREE